MAASTGLGWDISLGQGVWGQRWGAYLVSFVITTAVVVYGLNLPAFISGAPGLVREYYHTNFWKSNFLDVFLIAGYIYAGMVLAGWLGWSKSTAGQVAGIGLATALISGAFATWFLSRPASSLFFSRWFHAAGTSAVLYDVIIVTTIYWVAAAGRKQLG
jgi:hypothetical protein